MSKQESGDERLKEFRNQVLAVDEKINDARNILVKISASHKQIQLAVQQDDKKSSKEACTNYMLEVDQFNRDISESLKSIQTMTNDRKEQTPKEHQSTEIRIREAQHMRLLKYFHKLLFEYKEIQTEIQKSNIERTMRMARITCPKLCDLEDSELEKVIKDKEISEQTFLQLELTTSQKETINTYYNEAIETRREVQLIEASLIELQDLYITMGQLIVQQDDLIDNIETHVSVAIEHIKEGTEDTKKALSHQKNARCCTIAIILVLVIILIVSICIVTGVSAGVLYVILRTG